MCMRVVDIVIAVLLVPIHCVHGHGNNIRKAAMFKMVDSLAVVETINIVGWY